MIVSEALGGGGADFVECLESAICNTLLQLLKPYPHAFHRLHALRTFIGHAFIGVHDEDPHAGFLGRNFLDERFVLHRFFAGRDAAGALDPGAGRTLDIIEYLAATAAVATDDVAMATLIEKHEILARHHATITDEHHAPEPEALLEILQNGRNRLGIAHIAFEYMMNNRPAVDQHQSHQHLRIARLLIPAVTIVALVRRTHTLEVRRSQVVEHHVDPQREQVA